METHLKKIQTVCRGCGSNLQTSTSAVSVKSIHKLLCVSLRKYYFINENEEVHPNGFCFTCKRSILQENKRFESLNRKHRKLHQKMFSMPDYISKIGGPMHLIFTPKVFQEHSDDCEICHSTTDDSSSIGTTSQDIGISSQSIGTTSQDMGISSIAISSHASSKETESPVQSMASNVSNIQSETELDISFGESLNIRNDFSSEDKGGEEQSQDMGIHDQGIGTTVKGISGSENQGERDLAEASHSRSKSLNIRNDFSSDSSEDIYFSSEDKGGGEQSRHMGIPCKSIGRHGIAISSSEDEGEADLEVPTHSLSNLHMVFSPNHANSSYLTPHKKYSTKNRIPLISPQSTPTTSKRSHKG